MTHIHSVGPEHIFQGEPGIKILGTGCPGREAHTIRSLVGVVAWNEQQWNNILCFDLDVWIAPGTSTALLFNPGTRILWREISNLRCPVIPQPV